jgi:hypothetical protein
MAQLRGKKPGFDQQSTRETANVFDPPNENRENPFRGIAGRVASEQEPKEIDGVITHLGDPEEVLNELDAETLHSGELRDELFEKGRADSVWKPDVRFREIDGRVRHARQSELHDVRIGSTQIGREERKDAQPEKQLRAFRVGRKEKGAEDLEGRADGDGRGGLPNLRDEEGEELRPKEGLKDFRRSVEKKVGQRERAPAIAVEILDGMGAEDGLANGGEECG